jgi:hypothetical protein
MLPRLVAAALALIACNGMAVAAEPTRISDEASAIAAAKRYTKGRCGAVGACTYRARREGKQWNVLVEFKKRGGHVLLYFNQDGQLVRRVEGE